MSYRASVRVDVDALEDLSRRWEDLRFLLAANQGLAEKTATRAAQHLAGEVREYILDHSTASTRFYSGRTGGLARSFREYVRADAGGLSVGAESDSVYAKIHDKGGRIFAKRKFLAIPLIPMSVGKWPRHWTRGELFRPWKKGGKARAKLLVRKTGSGIEPVYVLTESVKRDPSNYSGESLKRAAPGIARMFTEMLKEGLRGK